MSRRLASNVGVVFSAFVTTAIWVAIGAIPIAICGLAFLHAARTPQWVWMLSGRTQIWWLAGLLIGIGVTPIGLPASLWYLIKIRPEMGRIETGNLSEVPH